MLVEVALELQVLQDAHIRGDVAVRGEVGVPLGGCVLFRYEAVLLLLLQLLHTQKVVQTGLPRVLDVAQAQDQVLVRVRDVRVAHTVVDLDLGQYQQPLLGRGVGAHGHGGRDLEQLFVIVIIGRLLLCVLLLEDVGVAVVEDVVIIVDEGVAGEDGVVVVCRAADDAVVVNKVEVVVVIADGVGVLELFLQRHFGLNLVVLLAGGTATAVEALIGLPLNVDVLLRGRLFAVAACKLGKDGRLRHRIADLQVIAAPVLLDHSSLHVIVFVVVHVAATLLVAFFAVVLVTHLQLIQVEQLLFLFLEMRTALLLLLVM